MKSRVLVVDDEPNIRRILQASFEKNGWQTTIAEDGYQALTILKEEPIDAVISDVTMPGMTGYELLKEIRDAHPGVEVVIMTAFGTIPQAIQAIRDGAFEFITKPFDLDVVKRIMACALEERKSPKETSRRPGVASKPKTQFIAESDEMKEVLETVQQVADSRATVLVTGESGTGKEVVAKLVHEYSNRSKKPFVAVSCAALPETLLESELFGYEKGAFTGAQGSKQGRFELASTGTLFLDEIGDIPMATQVKLLRVLQEREFERLGATKPTKVDVRLITATNRDLQEAVDDGTFRLDLMYRLQVVEIHLPPLRKRGQDILALARFFLDRYSRENGKKLQDMSSDAEATLLGYSWPGNVRELENTIERACVLAKLDEQLLTPRHLPQTVLKVA